MLRSATILALVGTAVAAGHGSYPTKEASCSALETELACKIKDETACTADASCVWEGSEYEWLSECLPSEAIQDQTFSALETAEAALKTQQDACSEYTEEAECSGPCGWATMTDRNTGQKSSSCLVARATSQAILFEDGADPLTRGMMYHESSKAITCVGSDEVKCVTFDACMWFEYEEYGTTVGECTTNVEAAMLFTNNKCDGSMNELLVQMSENLGYTNIDDVYGHYNVPAEYSEEKLAEQAKEKLSLAKGYAHTAKNAKGEIPTAGLAPADVTKLDFLAEAAMNGQTVKKIVATLEAESADTACTTTFEKMGLTSDDGACTAEAPSRRKLLASFTASVLLDPAKVDTNATATAVAKIEADSSVQVTATDENPVTEIKAIPGIDLDKVATFEAAAAVSAEMNLEVSNYEAESGPISSAASPVAAFSAIATAALAAAACVFA